MEIHAALPGFLLGPDQWQDRHPASHHPGHLSTVAEAMIRGWLRLQRLTPLSVTETPIRDPQNPHYSGISHSSPYPLMGQIGKQVI